MDPNAALANQGARYAAPSDMHVVRITTTSDQTYEFELPDDWAVIVEVDGRQYAGVTMSSEDHPVEVVYWPDEAGEDNVTVTPPGVPTEWPDETVDSDGNPLPRGRCDTCGAPCDPDTGNCTRDPAHVVAIP